jgi:hypothetical protein
VRHRPVRGSTHGRVKGGCPGGLHRKAILGCREVGVRCQPVRGSAHGQVEGQPGRGARGGACGGANDDDSVQGPNDARGGASGGAHDGCSGQGVSGARGGASGGAHAACVEGRADRRVGRAAAVASATVPMGAPVAATAPTACSREAAAA